MRDPDGFEYALTLIELGALAHNGDHKCPLCSCRTGPTYPHRHCEGQCNPTAFGLAEIPQCESEVSDCE